MLRRFILTFATLIFSQGVNACDAGSYAQLVKFWGEFRDASLNEGSVNMVKFYSFPLTFLGPYKEDKPVSISREIFLAKYDKLFRGNILDGSESVLSQDLKKIDEEMLKKEVANYTDKSGCFRRNLQVRIGDYIALWGGNSQWKISRIFYVEDFEELSRDMKRNPPK